MTDEDEILVKEGEYRLAKAYCMDAKIDAQELYCFLTGMDKVQLFLKAEEEVDPEIEEKYMSSSPNARSGYLCSISQGYRSLWDIRSRCRRTC